MRLEAKNISFRYSRTSPWVLEQVDFAVRSGLLLSSALFTQDQLTEIYRSIHETLDSEYPLTDERRNLLESAAGQIEDSVPDLDDRVYLSGKRRKGNCNEIFYGGYPPGWPGTNDDGFLQALHAL